MQNQKVKYETILKVAKKLKKNIDIGIRLNPNVDAKTIKEITTGKKF